MTLAARCWQTWEGAMEKTAVVDASDRLRCCELIVDNGLFSGVGGA